MKKIIHLLAISIFVTIFCNTTVVAQVNDTVSGIIQYEKVQLQQDLNYFVGVFRSVHPKPYWYQPTEEFDTALITFRNNLPDSASIAGFYSTLIPFVNAIGDENTRVLFPQSVLHKYIEQQGAFFPFTVKIIDGEVYVKKTFLTNNEIPEGTKIAAINNVGASMILKKMLDLIPGQNKALRMAEIEQSFSLLLWASYQFDAPFELGVRLPNTGIISTFNVQGVEAKVLGISTDVKKQIQRENIFETTIDKDRNFAVVKISDYQKLKELKKFLSSAFSQVKSSGVQNVIIDVRGNNKEEEAMVDEILKYVTRKPYRHYAAIEAKASPVTRNFYRHDYKSFMKKEKKSVLDKKMITKPYKMVLKGIDYESTFYAPDLKKPAGGGKSLEGEFYLLVDGGTQNSASVLAAVVQDNKLGLVIGLETGSRASRFKQLYHFILPNTGLECTVPHRYFLRPSSFDSGFGILPDYTVEPKPEDLANGKDTMVEFASQLFEKRSGFLEKQKAYEKRMKSRK